MVPPLEASLRRDFSTLQHDQSVERILHEAEKHAQDDSLDFFLAVMDDSEVFELRSVQSSDEQICAPEWDMLEGAALRAFLDVKQLLRHCG
jgi:hypothetical protein